MGNRLLQRALKMLLIVCLTMPVYILLPVYADNILIVESDFEDGTTQGWTARGSETVTVSGQAARSGAYGLETSNRTSSWHGPSLNITSNVNAGNTYVFTAWIRLPSGASDAAVNMTMQRTMPDAVYYEQIFAGNASSGTWTEFKAEYNLREPVVDLAVYFEIPNRPTQTFYLDDFRMERLPDAEPIVIEEDIPSLKDVFAGDFLIGSAFMNEELIEEADRKLLTKHFNSVTPGNVLKWDSTQPQEGLYRFAESDTAVMFAVNNGQRVRGHTLVWHNQTPDWVFRDASGNLVSKEVLFERMRSHIHTVVGRYKDDIYAWDVVNEVIDASQPDGLRRSLWYQIAGEEFIEKAFIYAHEADPDVLLFINDYNTHEPSKSQALYNLIKRLKDKGIPIHGVGHQTHIRIDYPAMSEIESSIVKFSDLGIRTEITELDMDVYANSSQSYDTLPDDAAQLQAQRYKELFDIFRRHKDLIDNVTLWGKDDGNTWLRSFPVNRKNWPLLFDERLQSKPAYWAIVDSQPQEPESPEVGLAVEYRTGDTNALDNQIRPHFRIVNNGAGAVPLSELTVRYWYTLEGRQSQRFHCDYATVGCQNIAGTHVRMEAARPGADHYLELTFLPSAGTVAAGSDTGEIRTRSNKVNWSNYNENNDYSFDVTKTSFAVWDKVTLYHNGMLVWGTEP